MPSLSPIFSCFSRRNRRHQPRENDRQVWQTCKSAIIKHFPNSCFANARREEEVREMMRDEEHEQRLTSVMRRAESMTRKLRENRSVGKSGPPCNPGVTISESDMETMAEELEPGCTKSRRANGTETIEGSAKEMNFGDEVHESAKSVAAKSVDNFDIADIERLEAEAGIDDDSKQFRNESVPTDALVHQERVPRTGTLHQLRFSKDHMQNDGTDEKTNHRVNLLYMHPEPTVQDMRNSVAGPSNATSKDSNIPVPPNSPASSATQLQEGQDQIPIVINEAPPPYPSRTIPKPSRSQASASSRVLRDLLEDLFRDIRTCVFDIEESLRRLAASAQKQQVVLAEKHQSMEIELRSARWDSEITEQLQTIAKCEKSNAELSKCLDAAVERLARAYYKGG